jgi:hypothetical protein
MFGGKLKGEYFRRRVTGLSVEAPDGSLRTCPAGEELRLKLNANQGLQYARRASGPSAGTVTEPKLSRSPS